MSYGTEQSLARNLGRLTWVRLRSRRKPEQRESFLPERVIPTRMGSIFVFPDSSMAASLGDF